MRVRLVLVLAIVVVLFAAAATFLALWRGGPGGPDRIGVLTTTYTDVRVGNAKAIAFDSPDGDHHEERVFLVRSAPATVHAFRGVSTHLGCRLLLPGDAGYGRGFTDVSRRTYFEDPCGGSVYSLDGDCTGGPCPRDLDRYAVEVRDDHVEIDTRDLTRGPARGS
jgi:Rieske Fe-S protein